jgi:hypothetical protein
LAQYWHSQLFEKKQNIEEILEQNDFNILNSVIGLSPQDISEVVRIRKKLFNNEISSLNFVITLLVFEEFKSVNVELFTFNSSLLKITRSQGILLPLAT